MIENNKENIPSQISSELSVSVKTYGDIYFNTLDTDNAIKFFEKLSILPNARTCSKCLSPMRKSKDKSRGDKQKWVCTSKTICGRITTIRSGTWLARSKLSLAQIAKIMFCWSHKLPQKFAVLETGVSAHSMVDWYNFCRDICSLALLNQETIKIGGEGKIVEIDESKFGKRKYNKGKRVEGQWVFGGIERDSDKMFMVSVPNRTKETLLMILEKYIEKETTIYSDCWSAYQTEDFEKYGWKHEKVNHSKHFKDPETGVHTNTIESNWRSTKASLPKYGTVKNLYDTYFSEYMWRRRFVQDDRNAFNMLVNHIVLYGKELEDTICIPIEEH